MSGSSLSPQIFHIHLLTLAPGFYIYTPLLSWLQFLRRMLESCVPDSLHKILLVKRFGFVERKSVTLRS